MTDATLRAIVRRLLLAREADDADMAAVCELVAREAPPPERARLEALAIALRDRCRHRRRQGG